VKQQNRDKHDIKVLGWSLALARLSTLEKRYISTTPYACHILFNEQSFSQSLPLTLLVEQERKRNELIYTSFRQ
jgi:hypothetical protein